MCDEFRHSIICKHGINLGEYCKECQKMWQSIIPGGIVFTDDPLEIIQPRYLRLSRDEYFMEIAKVASRRSTCPRASVGSVIVDHRNRIIGAGYNGSPAGHPHCLDVGCKTIEVEGKTYCIRTIHAEINALLTVESSSDRLILYSTHFPCFECIKAIASKGIRTVKYLQSYTDPKWELIKDEYSQISFIGL